MEGTFWAFLPAIVAIVLALISKQVYISLFFGIFVGAMMYAGGNPLKALFTLFNVMSEKVGANVPIIVFLVVLGILVVLMQKSGGARAYGDWAGKKIKSKGGALAATAGLGCLIFVDDYFNCLTVGSVMRPVTDKFKVSRSKLAYIIDATAAPICIIAPISSWAAAVTGELEGNVNVSDTYFASAQVSRQRARDEAMEVLQSVVENEGAAEAVKTQALVDLSKLAMAIEQEANIETLIMAKGFEKCVAVISDDTARIIVSGSGLTPAQIAQINEIVYEQAKISPVNITITEKS